MFTGLIEEIGIVHELQSSSVKIACKLIQDDLCKGDSIAVNGVCLTIVDFTSRWIQAEVMPATFRATNLGRLRAGSRVNLERAMTLGKRLGGHLVSGHIDTAVQIADTRDEGKALLVSIGMPSSLQPLIILKGSIAIDGISLTAAEIGDEVFTVSLVGHTREHTTLADKRTGELVNIECDQIGKYVQQFLSRPAPKSEYSSAMSMDLLKKHGFI